MPLLLSGGGSHVPMLDTFFAAHIDRSKKVLFIPVAQDASEVPYAVCLERFRQRMGRQGIGRVVLCGDLRLAPPLHDYAAIYLAGGNTYTLLREVRLSRFDLKLTQFLSEGGFVYGSSAGSILFGRNILATTYENEDTVGFADPRGLDLAHGYNICCHYGDAESRAYKRDRIRTYATGARGTIALPDDCGVFIQEGELTLLGSGVVLL